MAEHDDFCEADFVYEAGEYSPCSCDFRSSRGLIAAHDAQVLRDAEHGSCWDEAPTLRVRDGECTPMPPRCILKAGHDGAHQGPRGMHGQASEWMTRPPQVPDPRTLRWAADRLPTSTAWDGREWLTAEADRIEGGTTPAAHEGEPSIGPDTVVEAPVCSCRCHSFPGVSHIAPCCYEEGTSA